MRIAAIFVISVLLVGCGHRIQTYERLAQSTDIPLSTYVGGQVLKVQRASDLPNAFGKADVFGGKVDRGYTEVRFQGLAAPGMPIFRVIEVETSSTETTMSRHGAQTSAISARKTGNTVYGTVTTYNPPAGSTERLPPNATEFVLDLARVKEVSIAGVRVIVMEATGTSLSYRLSR